MFWGNTDHICATQTTSVQSTAHVWSFNRLALTHSLAHLLTSVKWESKMVALRDMGTQLLCSPPLPLHLCQGLGPLLPAHPHSPTVDHHLGDPLDLVGVWYRGTAFLVLFKTNVPQVQDTGNNSKEILGTWEVVRRAGREDSGRLIDDHHQRWYPGENCPPTPNSRLEITDPFLEIGPVGSYPLLILREGGRNLSGGQDAPSLMSSVEHHSSGTSLCPLPISHPVFKCHGPRYTHTHM